VRGVLKILPAGPIYRLTVDVKTIQHNQRMLRERRAQGDYQDHERPPCWVQVDDDKQNKINCWEVQWDGPSYFKYGEPHICGASMWLETTAELRIWTP
jgi:hypothetical protein